MKKLFNIGLVIGASVILISIAVAALRTEPNDPQSNKKFSSPQSEYVGHDITLEDAKQMELNFVAHKRVKTLHIEGYGFQLPMEDLKEVMNQPGAVTPEFRFSAEGDGKFKLTINALDVNGDLLPVLKERVICCLTKSLFDISLAKVKAAKADTLLQTTGNDLTIQ